jgi:hypothetical protein
MMGRQLYLLLAQQAEIASFSQSIDFDVLPPKASNFAKSTPSPPSFRCLYFQ